MDINSPRAQRHARDQRSRDDRGRAIDRAILPADEWKHVTVCCHSDEVTVTLNHMVVDELPLAHERTKTRLVKGLIGFRASWCAPVAPDARIRQLEYRAE